MLVDSKNFLFYWRLTERGCCSAAAAASPRRRSPESQFLRAMVAVHPQLAGVAVAKAWGGDVAITFDRLPPRAGSTVPGTPRGATARAWRSTRGWACASAATSPAAARPGVRRAAHRPIPLHRWRRAYLPAVGVLMRWHDRCR